MTFQGGSDSYAYAQLGNGGMDADGNHSGNLTLINTGNLTVTAGSGTDAYAMIGHGSDVRSVSRLPERGQPRRRHHAARG